MNNNKEIKCDPNCRFFSTELTSDWEDYYVGVAAECRATKPPTYLTEIGVGTIMDEGIKYYTPKITIEDAALKKPCVKPSLKTTEETINKVVGKLKRKEVNFRNGKERIKINQTSFLTWYRNACTSNTQEEANQIYLKLSNGEQQALREEYRSILWINSKDNPANKSV